MSTPHTHARVLAVLRRTWDGYLTDNGCNLTQELAEDFLASAHDALRTLADEIQTKLRLGVAKRYAFSEKKISVTSPPTFQSDLGITAVSVFPASLPYLICVLPISPKP